MVCCVFQATNLVNNYGQRKSARTFVSGREASNKLYTVLAVGIMLLSTKLNLLFPNGQLEELHLKPLFQDVN